MGGRGRALEDQRGHRFTDSGSHNATIRIRNRSMERLVWRFCAVWQPHGHAESNPVSVSGLAFRSAFDVADPPNFDAAFCAASTFSRNGNVKIYSCKDAVTASVYEVSAAHASAFGVYGTSTFLALSFLNAIADLLKRFSDESLQVHHLCPLHL